MAEVGREAGPPGAAQDMPVGAALEREYRIAMRKLRRLEVNVQRLEEIQDSNSRLLSRLITDLEEERERSHRLLLNVLPQRIIDRLGPGEARIADRHDDVTVLFSDVVSFTRISARQPAPQLVEDLNRLFSAFDAVCDAAGVEKIKTIGDAYLVVAGLPGGAEDHVAAAAETALGMLDALRKPEVVGGEWQIRVGLHRGPVAAGVLGTTKFAYDVWGDTVNVASRLQTAAEPGQVLVSAEVAQGLAGRFRFAPRGRIDLKGKGPTETWSLTRGT